MNPIRLVDKSDDNVHQSAQSALDDAMSFAGENSAKSVLIIFDTGSGYRTFRAGLRRPDELYMLETVKQDLF